MAAVDRLLLILPRQPIYPRTPNLLTLHTEPPTTLEIIKRRGVRTRYRQIYGTGRYGHSHIFLFASGGLKQ